jgi:hypothetical protein
LKALQLLSIENNGYSRLGYQHRRLWISQQNALFSRSKVHVTLLVTEMVDIMGTFTQWKSPAIFYKQAEVTSHHRYGCTSVVYVPADDSIEPSSSLQKDHQT